MIKEDLNSKIADKNVDINKYVQMITVDAQLRDKIVHMMLSDRNIMVYYHSYYIIGKASEERPDLFYNYWGDFVSLLDHRNSYHRNFGLTLIANLTKVDKENKFLQIFDNYFKCINDAKFMTASKCIQNTAKILANKEKIRKPIINILLDVDNQCDFPEKQKALLKSSIIDVFDKIYNEIDDKKRIKEFVKAELNSISPKTKKTAKNFIFNQIITEKDH